MKTAQRYEIAVAGLVAAVSNCIPEPSHQALVKCVRSFELLSNAKLATTRGGDGSHYLARRKVLAHDGTVVHENHEEWVKDQLLLDAGDAGKTYSRLRDAKFLLSKCEFTDLYLVHDMGTNNPAEFVQIAIRQEDEFIDALAFDRYAWETPKTLKDLLYLVEGETVPADSRRRIYQPVYQLDAVIDVEAFVAEAETIDAANREMVRRRTYSVSSGSESPDKARTSEVKTHDELFPGWDRQPHKARLLEPIQS